MNIQLVVIMKSPALWEKRGITVMEIVIVWIVVMVSRVKMYINRTGKD